jgi:tetratricopeptide (TPR) repeat protein
LAVGALVAVYAPALAGGFTTWDDDRFITDNPLFRGPVSAYVAAAFTRIQFEAYQPLHLIAYLPDRLLWPHSSTGFHLLNLAVFAAAVVVLASLARRVAPAWAATAAALAFALHPLCAEPIAWITARKDVVALLCAALVLALEDARGEARRPGLASPLVFAAAVLTKSAMVALPLVLAAWLLLVRRVPARAIAARLAPHAVIAAMIAGAVYLLWRGNQLIGPSRPVPAALDVPASLGFYASRVLAPLDLAPIYPTVPSLPGGATPTLWGHAAIAAAIAAAVALAWRRLNGLARFASVGFGCALLPVINIVPVYFRYADRYALLALAVLVPPLAAGLARARAALAARSRGALAVAAAAAALAVLGEATLARGQARAWASSAALWASGALAQPRAYLGRMKYGEVLRDAGRYADAAAEYRAAIRLDPERPLGYAGLLRCYAAEAEVAGRLEAGTGERWLRALGPALAQPAAFWRLSAEVTATDCARCAGALALLGVRRFAFPDSLLIDRAEAALAAGRPDLALVYLEGARDRTSPRYTELHGAARRALPSPRPQ